MATISKTGIAEGLTSKAEHLTRIIDALDGTATTELVATGSFTGSFVGTYAGTITSASYSTTAVSASYSATADTASYALNAQPGFPFSGDAVISGSLFVSGSFINFQSASQIILPNSTLGPSTITVAANTLPAGGRIVVLLSTDTQTITVELPTASDIYLGYEYTFDVATIGGNNAKFVIESGSAKISGTAQASSPGVYLNVDKLTMDTANGVRQSDTYMICSLGANGWRFNASARVSTSISSSDQAG